MDKRIIWFWPTKSAFILRTRWAKRGDKRKLRNVSTQKKKSFRVKMWNNRLTMQLHLILIRSSYLPEGRKSNASSYSFSNSKRQQLKEYIPIHTYMNVYQTGMNYTTFIFTLHFIFIFLEIRLYCTHNNTQHTEIHVCMYVCHVYIHVLQTAEHSTKVKN